MSSFLDWLGEAEPEAGDEKPNPLLPFDARSGKAWTLAEVEDLRPAKGIQKWTSYEQVKMTKTDPLSEFTDQLDATEHPEWGPIPAKDNVNLRFEFTNPDSPNFGRAMVWFAKVPRTTDLYEEDDFRLNDAHKDRKQLIPFLGSLLNLANVDLAEYPPVSLKTPKADITDDQWQKAFDIFAENADQFNNAEFSLQWRYYMWCCSSEIAEKSDKYEAGKWYLSDKVRPELAFE